MKIPAEYEEASNNHYTYESAYRINTNDGINIYRRGNLGLICFGDCKPTPAKTLTPIVSRIDAKYLPIINQSIYIYESNNNIQIAVTIKTDGTVNFYPMGATSAIFNLGARAITYMIKD